MDDALSPDRIRAAVENELSKMTVNFAVSGHKSSEGDGRTAADIERERAQHEEHHQPWD